MSPYGSDRERSGYRDRIGEPSDYKDDNKDDDDTSVMEPAVDDEDADEDIFTANGFWGCVGNVLMYTSIALLGGTFLAYVYFVHIR